MIALLLTVIALLCGIIGGFIVGFYSRPAWAGVKGRNYDKLIYIINGRLRAIIVLYYGLLTFLVGWTLIPIAEWLNSPPEYDGGAVLILALFAPVAIHCGVFGRVADWANRLSCNAMSDEEIRTLRRKEVEGDDQHCVVVR